MHFRFLEGRQRQLRIARTEDGQAVSFARSLRCFPSRLGGWAVRSGMARRNSRRIRLAACGVVCVALAVLLAGCTDAMRQRDRLRIERVENAVLPMAMAALETGQMETAKRLYGRLLEVDPESFRARMGLGETALRERQPADAARWYAQAIEVAQVPAQRHEALLAHGRAALESGQLQAAQESFARLASPEEQAPQASAAWGLNGVGLTQLLQDDLSAAVESMERAVLWAPSEPMFRENLARARAMLADREPLPDEEVPVPATPSAIEPAAPAPVPEARAAPSVADESADALASEALPEATETLAEAPLEAADALSDMPSGRAEDAPVPADAAETSEARAAPSAEDASSDALASEALPDATETLAEAPLEAADALSDMPVERAEDSPVPGDAAETSEARAAPSAEDASADALASEALPDATETLAEVPLEAADALSDMPVDRAEDSPVPGSIAETSEARAASSAEAVPVELPPEDRPPESELVEEISPEGTAETSEARDAPWAEDEPDADGDAPAESASEAAPPRDPRGFLVREGGQQFVQMGAYRVRDSAFSLAARLREMTDERVFVLEGSLYRVRIGPLASQSALDMLSDALDAAGFGRPRRVPSAGAEVLADAGTSAAATGTSANPPSEPLGIRPLMVSGEEGRFMQFGAFQSHAKAEALALRLQESIAVPVFIMETQQESGALLHRVRAGPIDSDATQRDLADAAQSLGFEIE